MSAAATKSWPMPTPPTPTANHGQLRELLVRWKTNPEAIQGDDIASRLIRTIRLIARVRTQTDGAREELKMLRRSDLYFLRQRAASRQAHAQSYRWFCRV